LTHARIASVPVAIVGNAKHVSASPPLVGSFGTFASSANAPLCGRTPSTVKLALLNIDVAVHRDTSPVSKSSQSSAVGEHPAMFAFEWASAASNPIRPQPATTA